MGKSACLGACFPRRPVRSQLPLTSRVHLIYIAACCVFWSFVAWPKDEAQCVAGGSVAICQFVAG